MDDEEAKYLSTPDVMVSDQELGELPDVAKAAAAHADRLQKQLQDLQSGMCSHAQSPWITAY